MYCDICVVFDCMFFEVVFVFEFISWFSPVSSVFISMSQWFWCWVKHLSMTNVMINDTTFYHFHDVFVFIFYVMISAFFSWSFDCFAFVKKFCHDYFHVFTFSVIFIKNCDQNNVEICEYQKKHEITKKFMSKKLQSKTKLYNIQIPVNTTLVIFVNFTLFIIKTETSLKNIQSNTTQISQYISRN